jgi:hypothetical protein
MEFAKVSDLYSLNKSTYVNLRWIAYIGQISAILIVQFLLQYKFKLPYLYFSNYFKCLHKSLFAI